MKTQSHNTFHRLLSITAISTLVAFVAVGGFLIHAASKKRSFDGKLIVTACRKLPNGQWEKIETIEDRLSFEGSLIEAASGKQFTTNQVLSKTSSKGNRFTAVLQGNVKLNADLTSGRFDLTSVPIRLNLNGKQHAVEFSCTTESISAPNGESFSGKRVRIVNKEGDIAVVGVSKVPVVINHEEQFAGNKKVVDKKKATEELIFILRAEGRIAAK
jgi:hypothetical protein